jgi:hypothetical protein
MKLRPEANTMLLPAALSVSGPSSVMSWPPEVMKETGAPKAVAVWMSIAPVLVWSPMVSEP